MEFTRASQVATGVLFHSSMTTSRSWWMLETLHSSTFRLRMPHRCSIGFRSGDMLGQSIAFTLSFFSKAVVVIMLEYCPAAQSPKGGDHALLQYIKEHVGIHVPSIKSISPVPAALMQHQTMTLLPPCLTVGKTHLSLYSSPGGRHTRLTPSEPNNFILVSSDHRTWFQSSYSHNYFFQILREFFAMRCHVELPVTTSMRK